MEGVGRSSSEDHSGTTKSILKLVAEGNTERSLDGGAGGDAALCFHGIVLGAVGRVSPDVDREAKRRENDDVGRGECADSKNGRALAGKFHLLWKGSVWEYDGSIVEIFILKQSSRRDVEGRRHGY